MKNTQVTIAMPIEAAQKILNNPKAFYDWAKQNGFDIEHVYLNKESFYDLCPACNSLNKTKLAGNVSQCADCGGIYGKITREIALKYVRLNDMTANTRDQFYFDFTLDNNRIHGWACCDTKRVVQWG